MRLVDFLGLRFPRVFPRWTPYQLRLASVIELAVLDHVWCERPVIRGCGSTSLLTAAAIWAGAMRLARVVVLVGSTAQKAEQLKARMAAHLAARCPEKRWMAIGSAAGDEPYYATAISIGSGDWRGLSVTTGGKVLRPDLVLFDEDEDVPVEERQGHVRDQRVMHAKAMFGCDVPVRGVVLTRHNGLGWDIWE